MSLVARDIMRTDVHVVNPEMSLIELERHMLEKSVSGFPVLRDGKLVGIVSRSDVVRALCVEQSLAETATYLYKVHTDEGEDSQREIDEVAERVLDRVENFRVKDVMVVRVICVSPGDSLQDVARTLLKHDIHRVPVTEGGQLLGIVSTLDLTRLVAEGGASID